MDADRGPGSLAVSALLHAGIFAVALALPPGLDALDTDRLTAPRPTVTLLSVPAAPARASGAATAQARGAGAREHARDPGPAPGPRARRSRARDAVGDAHALLAAMTGALAAHTATRSAFVATDALAARVFSNDAGGGGSGLDMIGTGRGTGAGDGDTIGAPSASGWGVGGTGATCGGPELERRTARMGRAAAVASCSADANRGALRGAGFRSRGVPAGAPFTRCVARTCAPTPHVWCGGPAGCNADVRGSLSREVIRRVVARHRNEVRYCYEHALVSRPDLAGRVTSGWTVAPDGHVLGASIDAARSDLGSADVEDCIAHAVSRWTFPTAEGVTIVSYPFVLGTED